MDVKVIRRLVFLYFFSPMRNASAKGLGMKAPFNNNLPIQTKDVVVNPKNPVNPDSKTTSCCALKIKLLPIFLLNPENPDSKTTRCCALNSLSSPQLDCTSHAKKVYL